MIVVVRFVAIGVVVFICPIVVAVATVLLSWVIVELTSPLDVIVVDIMVVV